LPKAEEDLLVAFELHSVEAIGRAFDAGADPLSPIRGKSPVTSLVEMYTRSTRFPDCLRLLLERGAVLDDPVVAPVLLDGHTPLFHTVNSNGNHGEPVLRLLLEAGARLLLEAAGREVPPLENVPNRHLLPKSAATGA
jgi:hypothetical protein